MHSWPCRNRCDTHESHAITNEARCCCWRHLDLLEVKCSVQVQLDATFRLLICGLIEGRHHECKDDDLIDQAPRARDESGVRSDGQSQCAEHVHQMVDAYEFH